MEINSSNMRVSNIYRSLFFFWGGGGVFTAAFNGMFLRTNPWLY